jgi:hypothetical protein
LDKLTGLYGRGGSEHGDQLAVSAHLDPENAESGLLAMEGHPFDQAGEGFAVVIIIIVVG